MRLPVVPAAPASRSGGCPECFRKHLQKEVTGSMPKMQKKIIRPMPLPTGPTERMLNVLRAGLEPATFG